LAGALVRASAELEQAFMLATALARRDPTDARAQADFEAVGALRSLLLEQATGSGGEEGRE